MPINHPDFNAISAASEYKMKGIKIMLIKKKAL
jgi:hypothetical protein